MVFGHHSWPGFCHLPLLGEVSLRVNPKFNSWVDPKAHWIKALIWDIIVFWYFWCSLWCSALVVFVLFLVFFAVRSGVYFSGACPLTFPCFSICGCSDALFFVLCSLPFRAFRRGMFCRFHFACLPGVFVVLFLVFFHSFVLSLVFFGFLLVCHALQRWRGVSLFPAVLGVCTIHFLLKCCRFSLFWWISRPLGLPYFTDVCFFVTKMFLFDILERYLAVLCRSYGIMGSRVLPFPGAGVDFSL